MYSGPGEVLLRIDSLRFSFLPGQPVVNGVSFTLSSGEILGLAGENGAGKTTMARILAGQLSGYTGEFRKEKSDLRVALVPQHPEFARDFTLGENLILGREGKSLFTPLDFTAFQHRLDRAAGPLGYHLDVRRRAGQLTPGELQKAALAGALLDAPDVLILDEPTSSLPPKEAEALLESIRNLAAQEGLAVIIISHRLEEMMNLCGALLILEDGRLKTRIERRDFDLQHLSSLLIGTPQVNPGSFPVASIGRDPLLEVKSLTALPQRRGSLMGLNFSLYPGEILGLAGLREEGLESLEDCLSGLKPWSSGRVVLNGREIPPGSPVKFRKNGLGYVPADRMHRGSVPEASILENLIPHQTTALSRRGILQKERTTPFFRKLQEMMGFEGRPDQKLKELSGGNIQRLILSRELEVQPDVLLLSQPSWGLDLASRRVLHDLLRDLRAQGRGILLLSTDLGELLDLSDRLGVVYQGKITQMKPVQDWASADLDRAILGES